MGHPCVSDEVALAIDGYAKVDFATHAAARQQDLRRESLSEAARSRNQTAHGRHGPRQLGWRRPNCRGAWLAEIGSQSLGLGKRSTAEPPANSQQDERRFASEADPLGEVLSTCFGHGRSRSFRYVDQSVDFEIGEDLEQV